VLSNAKPNISDVNENNFCWASLRTAQPTKLKTKDIMMLYRFVVLGLMKERLDARDGIISDMDVALGATDQSQHHEPLTETDFKRF
jgi:hypothetical protein